MKKKLKKGWVNMQTIKQAFLKKIEETISKGPYASVDQIIETKSEGILWRFKKSWLKEVSKKLFDLFQETTE